MEDVRQNAATSDPEAALAVIDEAPQHDAPRLFNPWLIAIVVTVGTFMEVLDTSIANVALPHIAGSLSASQDESAWVLTSYLVANAIILPMSGWISSIIGRKRFYLLSVTLFTVFSACCGFAPTLGLLLLFRVLQGLAGGGLQPSVQAILADTFPAEKRGMAMALYTVAILVAPVLGPTLGGWITDNYSWRWIFYINIPCGLVCVFLTRMVLQDPPYLIEQIRNRTKKISVDYTGIGLIAIGLATFEIVLDKGQELDWFGSSFIVTFASIAAISLLAAIIWEWYHPAPIINLRLLKERNFLFCCLIVLALYAALYATTYLLPQFMEQLMGYTATTAGLVLSPAGLVTMAEVPLVGYLLTRGADARKVAFFGLVLIGASCIWMAHLSLEVAPTDMVWPRVLQVMGVGITTVPISTVVFRFLPKEQSSNAAGIYALVRNEGGSIGIALSSTLLQRTAQLHQTVLAQNMTVTSAALQNTVAATHNLFSGNLADGTYIALANLYNQMQRQAQLLAYMDQFRLLGLIVFAIVPLVFFLKRPPLQKKIELDVH